MEAWKLQVIGLSLLAVVLRFVEKKAAMRGCNQNPLPAWLDRSFRFVFLLVLMGPTAYVLDTEILPFPMAIPVVILYLISYIDLCEQHGGRSTLYARNWKIWGWLRRRLHLKLVKTHDLPQASYIFGVHPHGILPFGAMIALGSQDQADPSSFVNLFPGIDYRALAATFCFYIPIYRDMMLFGGVVDAARYSAHYILSTGKSLLLVPGGATEALYCDHTKDIVYLKKRTGFIRLALETGAALVPVFSFNECNAYRQWGTASPTVDKIKKKFQSIFGISLPLIKNIFPLRTHITVVVGKPISVPKIASPSKEEVQRYLDLYIEGLTALYEENKEKYNIPKTKPSLTII